MINFAPPLNMNINQLNEGVYLNKKRNFIGKIEKTKDE